MDSVLTAVLHAMCAVVPQDDWMEYASESPDKVRIVSLIESETTFAIGKETKPALSICSNARDWIRQRPVVQLQLWLPKRQDGESDISKETGKSTSSVRMLLSIVPVWNCTIVKVHSNNVVSGKLTKKDIIDDCKKHIQTIICWKDCGCRSLFLIVYRIKEQLQRSEKYVCRIFRRR